jgi:hypothetical protein
MGSIHVIFHRGISQTSKNNSKLQFQKTISVANRYWETTVVGECNLEIVLLLVGGFIMFVACVISWQYGIPQAHAVSLS